MSTDIELIRQNKPQLTENSVVTYAAHVRRVRKVSPELTEAAVLKYLDSLKPTIANQLVSAIVALKPEFHLHVKRYRTAAETIRAATVQKSTKKQRDNWVSVAAIKRATRLMRREINQFGFDGDHKLVMAYLTWSIMLEHTMRNDLPSIKIAETTADFKKGQNFYIVSKGEIWMSRFKTSRAFASRDMLPLKLPLQKSLKSFILRYLRERAKKFDSNFLICLENGKPYSKAGFRNLMINSSKNSNYY